MANKIKLAFERKKVILEKRRVLTDQKRRVKTLKRVVRDRKLTKTPHVFEKELLKSAKLEKAVAKKEYKAVVKKGKKSSSLKKLSSQQLDSAAQSDDTFSDLINAKYRYQSLQINGQRAQKVVKGFAKGTSWTVKRGYGIGNRLYNYHNGRGFVRTPKQFSWQGRLGKKVNAIKMRFNKSKIGKFSKGTGKVLRVASSPFKAILRNPFSIKAYVILFILLVAAATVVGGGAGVTRQDEFDLSRTWTYFTKLDREKSTKEVDYYTKIDEPLLFLNYRFEEIRKRLRINNDPRYFTEIPRGKQYLTRFWQDLNGDRNNLKTVESLYKEKSPYKLSAEELEEYEEAQGLLKDIGKYSLLRELSSPFEDDPNDESMSTLYIQKRFGYETKDEMFNGSVLKATKGTTVYAVMRGTVTVDGNNLEIATNEAKFTYENLENIRFETGQTIRDGDIVGEVGSETGLTIYYQKLEANREEKKGEDGKVLREWVYVNPGFYFPFVEYTQSTSVVGDIDLSGGKAQRAREFANQIRKQVPEARDEGIASVLGGFDIESSITFKRYETDYLTDHQFDKVAQEPTAENLVGSWSAFEAMYPNLRLNKSGYYVDGRHYIGIGIGQWTGPRGLALWNYAKELNKDLWAAETQVKFLFERDTPGRIDALKRIVTSEGTVESLTEDFLNSWLGVPGNKLLERQNVAKQWLNFLKKQGTGTTGIASQQVPEEYRDILPYGLPTDKSMLEGQGYPGNAYDLGNCTWYVYNRFAEIGISIHPFLGNAHNWAFSAKTQGYEVSSTPTVGSAVVYQPGVAGSHSLYGHVSFCEYVNSDGSFLVSEMNMNGLYSMTWRVLKPQEGIQFVIPK